MIALLIFLIIVGIIIYYIPMDTKIKNIVYVIILIVVLLWIANFFGLIGSGDLKIGR